MSDSAPLSRQGDTERCAAGRLIEPRAVTVASGCDDWFHADDGTHCQHDKEAHRGR